MWVPQNWNTYLKKISPPAKNNFVEEQPSQNLLTMYLMILFSYRKKKKSKQSFRKKIKKDIAGKIDLINRAAKGKIK